MGNRLANVFDMCYNWLLCELKQVKKSSVEYVQKLFTFRCVESKSDVNTVAENVATKAEGNRILVGLTLKKASCRGTKGVRDWFSTRIMNKILPKDEGGTEEWGWLQMILGYVGRMNTNAGERKFLNETTILAKYAEKKEEGSTQTTLSRSLFTLNYASS